MNVKAICALLCALSLTACSTYKVTYVTQPPGAELRYKNGDYIGIATSWVDYGRSSQYINHRGCFQVQGVIARWPSGATAESESIIELCQGTQDYTYTLIRPSTSEGQALDIQNGNAVLLQRQQEHLAREQTLMNAAAILGGANYLLNSYQTGIQQGQIRHQQQQELVRQQKLQTQKLDQIQRNLERPIRCESRPSYLTTIETECW